MRKPWKNIRKKDFQEGTERLKVKPRPVSSPETRETRSILVQGRAVEGAETVMDVTGFGLLHKDKGESLEGSELTNNNQT